MEEFSRMNAFNNSNGDSANLENNSDSTNRNRRTIFGDSEPNLGEIPENFCLLTQRLIEPKGNPTNSYTSLRSPERFGLCELKHGFNPQSQPAEFPRRKDDMTGWWTKQEVVPYKCPWSEEDDVGRQNRWLDQFKYVDEKEPEKNDTSDEHWRKVQSEEPSEYNLETKPMMYTRKRHPAENWKAIQSEGTERNETNTIHWAQGRKRHPAEHWPTEKSECLKENNSEIKPWPKERKRHPAEHWTATQSEGLEENKPKIHSFAKGRKRHPAEHWPIEKCEFPREHKSKLYPWPKERKRHPAEHWGGAPSENLDKNEFNSDPLVHHRKRHPAEHWPVIANTESNPLKQPCRQGRKRHPAGHSESLLNELTENGLDWHSMETNSNQYPSKSSTERTFHNSDEWSFPKESQTPNKHVSFAKIQRKDLDEPMPRCPHEGLDITLFPSVYKLLSKSQEDLYHGSIIALKPCLKPKANPRHS